MGNGVASGHAAQGEHRGGNLEETHCVLGTVWCKESKKMSNRKGRNLADRDSLAEGLVLRLPRKLYKHDAMVIQRDGLSGPVIGPG